MPVCHTANTGGGEEGLTCHDFGYGRATGDPGPRPIHILGEVKKNQTHSYTHVLPISKIVPIHILFFKF